eukprot:CAMPEP_0168336692 /NCGR_PEP_ID=MMETSP0213-20121227/11714_1 /TAXON_ID=151035 /ORGANISM="Euplotes harpa, Strain FSP1.4" /LENGTH=94 /DNA_ID=CAMNT_0008341975 /DNA_START=31 /DNA_END=315 /DNA_ORIENTATION=+
MRSSKKLKLSELYQYMTEGLAQCSSEQAKEQFGRLAMQRYDYLHDAELRKYMLHDSEQGAYYRNLIFRNDVLTMKNLFWNPGSVTKVHGHRESD